MRPPHPLILLPFASALAFLGAVAWCIWPRPTVVQVPPGQQSEGFWADVRRIGREQALINPMQTPVSSVMPEKKP